MEEKETKNTKVCKCEKYKQALAEISNFLENFCDICPNADKDTFDYCNDGCLLDPIALPIFDIITESKNDNNERNYYEVRIKQLEDKLQIAQEALEYYANGEDISEESTNVGNTVYVVPDGYTDFAYRSLQKMKEVQ